MPVCSTELLGDGDGLGNAADDGHLEQRQVQVPAMREVQKAAGFSRPTSRRALGRLDHENTHEPASGMLPVRAGGIP